MFAMLICKNCIGQAVAKLLPDAPGSAAAECHAMNPFIPRFNANNSELSLRQFYVTVGSIRVS